MPLPVHLTPGHGADSPQALCLLTDLTPFALLADKAYDTNRIVQALTNPNIQIVIPPKANGIHQPDYD